MHRHRCRNEKARGCEQLKISKIKNQKALDYAKAINKNLQIIMRLNPNLHQGQR